MSHTHQTISCLTAFWMPIAAHNYKKERTTNGRLHKNGHGWEVLDTP
jgi:hypothetical protein